MLYVVSKVGKGGNGTQLNRSICKLFTTYTEKQNQNLMCFVAADRVAAYDDDDNDNDGGLLSMRGLLIV